MSNEVTNPNQKHPLIQGLHLPSEIMRVVMWLYEKHGIWIVVFPTEQDWTFDIFKGLDCVKSESFFNTPVNAYEAAIKYALNNLV